MRTHNVLKNCTFIISWTDSKCFYTIVYKNYRCKLFGYPKLNDNFTAYNTKYPCLAANLQRHLAVTSLQTRENNFLLIRSSNTENYIVQSVLYICIYVRHDWQNFFKTFNFESKRNCMQCTKKMKNKNTQKKNKKNIWTKKIIMDKCKTRTTILSNLFYVITKSDTYALLIMLSIISTNGCSN